MKPQPPEDSVATTIKQIFGKNLRALRIRAGKSQDHFAEDNAINREYLSRLERGKSIPSLEVVARAAYGAGVPIGILIEGIEEAVAQVLAEVIPSSKQSRSARTERKPYVGPPKKGTLADLRELGLQGGLTLRSRKYVRTSTPYLWTCSAGHKVKANPGNLRARIKNGLTPCVRCARIERGE